jgi:hypothetical protein
MRTRLNDDGAGTVGGWLVVVMLQLLLALPAAESVTLAVKLFEPTPLGVPVTAPVEEFSAKPAGSTPGVMEYNV